MSQLEIQFNALEKTPKCLEDIPLWQEKMKLRELALYNRDMAKEGKLFFSYKDSADMEARQLNLKYGGEVAVVHEALKGWRVSINAPYRNMYQEILLNEETDELLPHRETEIIKIEGEKDKKRAA